MMEMINPKINTVIIFDIRGPIAHFRKYDSNTSALSYPWPPKPVIAGIIGAILGLPNEKEKKNKEKIYYEKLTGKESFIAVSPRNKIRKMTQTVNYNYTKRDTKTIEYTKATPVPIEIILPEKDKEIIYRIFFYHKDENIYEKLKNNLKEKKTVYPVYLGVSEFIASLKYIDEGRVTAIGNTTNEINFKSICKFKEISPIVKNNSGYIFETMPTGFSNERVATLPEDYIFSLNNLYIKARLKNGACAYLVEYKENKIEKRENIMFL